MTLLPNLEVRTWDAVYDLEKTLISAIVRSEKSRATVFSMINTTHLYHPDRTIDGDLQKIFSTCLEYFVTGVNIAKETLYTELNKRQRKFLDDCLDIDFSESSIEHICKKIQDEAYIREIYKIAEETKIKSQDPSNDFEHIMSNLYSNLISLTHNHNGNDISKVGDYTDSILTSLEQKTKSKGVTSTLRDLDYLIDRFENKTLSLIAARPSFGKTQFALQVCIEAALKGIPVLFVSLEMSEEQINRRILSYLSGVDSLKIRKKQVTSEDLEKIKLVVPTLLSMPLYIISGTMGVPELAAKARKMSIKNKGNLGLIIVDYLQLMNGSGGTGNEKLESIAIGLKQIAMDLDVPIIALSQLNRDVEKREGSEPILSDLRGSGMLEQAAQVVIFLHKPNANNYGGNNRDDLRIIVAKNRDGETGAFDVVNDVKRQRILDSENSQYKYLEVYDEHNEGEGF